MASGICLIFKWQPNPISKLLCLNRVCDRMFLLPTGCSSPSDSNRFVCVSFFSPSQKSLLNIFNITKSFTHVYRPQHLRLGLSPGRRGQQPPPSDTRDHSIATFTPVEDLQEGGCQVAERLGSRAMNQKVAISISDRAK